jgi:hypothetical protein
MSYDYGSGYSDEEASAQVNAEKDPDAVQDFKFVWVLGDDVITASEFIVDGATEDSNSFDDTSATIFMSGGAIGMIVKLTNRITTAQGRIYDKTVRIRIREQ